MLQSLNIILWLHRPTSGLDKEEVQTIKEKSLIGMLACWTDITVEKKYEKERKQKLSRHCFELDLCSIFYTFKYISNKLRQTFFKST